MIGYIVIYVILGMIASSFEDEKNAFWLMGIGALVSLLTAGFFVVAAIIEMGIGFAIGNSIKNNINLKAKKELEEKQNKELEEKRIDLIEAKDKNISLEELYQKRKEEKSYLSIIFDWILGIIGILFLWFMVGVALVLIAMIFQ